MHIKKVYQKEISMKKLLSILAFLYLIAFSNASFANDNPLLSADFLKKATPETVQQMIDKGYNVNDRTEGGFTPIMFASALNTNPEIITTLLQNDAKVNDRTKSGEKPLMLASAKNLNPEVITILLKNGANINDRDKLGSTPLMFASRFNSNPEIITTLLQNGADVKAKDTDGKTALDYAQENPKIYRTDAYWQMNNLMYE